MSTISDVCPRRSAAVMVNVDEGQVITVTNPLTGKVFIFNDTAKRILELCDGATSGQTIAGRIATEFHGADIERVTRDAEEFLAACLGAGLLTPE